jgi:hypothetical protein
MTQGEIPDDITTKSGGTNRIPMSFTGNQHFAKKSEDQISNAGTMINGIEDA